MAEDSDLRRRTAAKQQGVSPEELKRNDEKAKKSESDQDSGSAFSFLDVLRVLTALLIVSFVGSYFVTRGDSFIWGLTRPWWTKPKMIQAAFVSAVAPVPNSFGKYVY